MTLKNRMEKRNNALMFVACEVEREIVLMECN